MSVAFVLSLIMLLKLARFTIYLAMTLSMANAGNDERVIQSLQEFQWQQRLILLLASGNVPELKKRLEAAKQEIDDRDIYWFIIEPDTCVTNAPLALADGLLQQLRAEYFSAGNHVILIGKDGGIKARSEKLDLPQLFALIDSMPMRQAEIHDKLQE